MQEENQNPIKVSVNQNQSKNDGVFGPIIGSSIIILLIVLGGLYFWSFLIQERESQSEVKGQESLETEVELLGKEIESQTIDEIDSDIKMLEDELDAAFEDQATTTE